MPVGKTLGAYVIITYLGSKETDFCWKNIVNNFILKSFYVTFYFVSLFRQEYRS